MTSIVIGGRSRALTSDGRIFLSGQTLFEDFHLNAHIVESAMQIVWTYYTLDDYGQVDYDESLRRTEKILNKVSKYNKNIIFLSTDAVFSGDAGPYSESDTPQPQSLYGKTKLAQELLMKDYPRLRFTIFGPSFNPQRPLMIEMIARKMISIDRPNQYFSPISTITLNSVIDRFQQEHTSSLVYHLAGTSLSKSDCVNRLRAKLGMPLVWKVEEDKSKSNLSLSSKTHYFDFDEEVKLAINEMIEH
jgi:RmlD substrate binding domain